VVVLQPGGEADFATEVLEHFLGHQMSVRDFQGHAAPLDRVSGLKYDGESTFAELTLDAILAESLFRPHGTSWTVLSHLTFNRNHA
jgi:hypothetical protein